MFAVSTPLPPPSRTRVNAPPRRLLELQRHSSRGQTALLPCGTSPSSPPPPSSPTRSPPRGVRDGELGDKTKRSGRCFSRGQLRSHFFLCSSACCTYSDETNNQARDAAHHTRPPVEMIPLHHLHLRRRSISLQDHLTTHKNNTDIPDNRDPLDPRAWRRCR